jgi:hypothetical protein
MPLPIEASEIAEGDWTEVAGTVRTVKENRDKAGNLQSLDFTFWNGKVEYGVDPNAIFIVEQGGLNDRPPSSTIRPGLISDV